MSVAFPDSCCGILCHSLQAIEKVKKIFKISYFVLNLTTFKKKIRYSKLKCLYIYSSKSLSIYFLV